MCRFFLNLSFHIIIACKCDVPDNINIIYYYLLKCTTLFMSHVELKKREDFMSYIKITVLKKLNQ